MSKLLVGILLFIAVLIISEFTPFVDWLFLPDDLSPYHYFQYYLLPIPPALALFFLADKRNLKTTAFSYLLYCAWNFCEELVRMVSGLRLNEFFSWYEAVAVIIWCVLVYWYHKRLERKEMERLAGFIM